MSVSFHRQVAAEQSSLLIDERQNVPDAKTPNSLSDVRRFAYFSSRWREGHPRCMPFGLIFLLIQDMESRAVGVYPRRWGLAIPKVNKAFRRRDPFEDRIRRSHEVAADDEYPPAAI